MKAESSFETKRMLIAKKIPSFTAYPPEENIKMTENLIFIYVDVETTSNDTNM